MKINAELNQKLQDYLDSVSGGTAPANGQTDANGAPTFNRFNERTDVKGTGIKFYKHEEFAGLTTPHFYVFSDIHAGTEASELERVRRQIEMAEKDPNAVVILNGDNIDFSVPDSVGDSFSQTEGVGESLARIKNMFAELDAQGKIAANHGGNHDHDRAYKYMGHSFVDQYTKNPGIFSEGMAVHQFVLRHVADPEKTVSLNVLVQHGQIAKGGPLGTIASGIRAAQNLFGSTIHAAFLGHTHQNAFGTDVKFVRDMDSDKSTKNIISVFAVPSAVVTQDYAAKKGYKPSNTDNNVIVFEQKVDDKAKSAGEVYFHPYQYSIDALYAASNMMHTEEIKDVKKLSKMIRSQGKKFSEKLSKLVSKAMKGKKTETDIDRKMQKAYNTELYNLIELQEQMSQDRETPMSDVPQAQDYMPDVSGRQDTPFGLRENGSLNKYNTTKSKLPEGLTNIHLYVLSDVFINSDLRSRVNLQKFKSDIKTMADDPKALMVINGNLFEFDDGIFGFKRGEPTKTAFMKFEANYSVVSKEFEGFGESTTDAEKHAKLSSMSDTDKLSLYKKVLENDEYKGTAFREELDREAMVSMQKTVYGEYIQLFKRILTPIKDKIVIMNEGSQETKIKNFRDYSPLEELSKALDLQHTATDSRFWTLEAGFKNFMTDGKRRTATVLGAYGTLNANTKTALQNKIETEFKDFGAYDIEVVSGYSQNAIYKENIFYTSPDGTVYLMPKTIISFAGYRKVLEPNKVRMKSYIAEPDMNRFYADISVYRDPAYISENYIGADGKVIKYDEEFFASLRRVENPEGLDKITLQNAIKIPYKVDANLVPYKSRENLFEQSLADNSTSEKLKHTNMATLVETQKVRTTEAYEQSRVQMTQRIMPHKNPYIKLYDEVMGREAE